ncbi:MAG: DUF389 domain-containing protein [Solirubrobacterales bacterium]
MMHVEVFGPSAAMARAAAAMDGLDGVTAVRQIEATRPGHSVIAASVRPRAVDPVLDELMRLSVPESDITVLRVETIEWTATRPSGTSLVWADVLGQAWVNARPIARYLTLLFIAGVIAGYGVLERNGILIVGAMAVSPDLLPITAIAVGLVGKTWRLAGEAMRTLAVGMAMACAAAALVAFAQDQFDLIPSGFSLSSASDALGGLASISHETITVAFAAGVAGMLALETRASSAVGVAVSVTTIPAAAYLGVAAGLRRGRDRRRRLGPARHERRDDDAGRLRDAHRSAVAQAACRGTPRTQQGGR